MKLRLSHITSQDHTERMACPRLPWTQVWKFGGPTQWCHTLTDGPAEEQAALVAGVTGNKIIEGEVTEDDVTYPSVQAVLGWGLLMYPNSVFN